MWHRLASLVSSEYSAHALRDECLNALHVAVAYSHDKIFKPLQEWPWCLASGNIEENLRALGALEEEPWEPLAKKLWTLLSAGQAPRTLVDILVLLRDVPFSTINVEQAHGSSSTIRRFHPALDLDVHMQRAFLHQCRHLFLPSQVQKEQAKTAERVSRLQARSKRALSARHVFFKHLAEAASRRAGPGHLSSEAMQGVMTAHTTLYASMQPSERLELQRQARRLTESKRLQKEQALEEVMTAQTLATARQQKQQNMEGLSNFASACKYDDVALTKLASHVAQVTAWTLKQLQNVRLQAQESPREPLADIISYLQNMDPGRSKPARAEPVLWVKVLCEQGADLQGIIVGPSFDSGEVVYRFLYASQNPSKAVFQLLKCLDWRQGAASRFGSGSLIEHIDRCRPRLLQMMAGEYCSHQDSFLGEHGLPGSRLQAWLPGTTFASEGGRRPLRCT